MPQGDRASLTVDWIYAVGRLLDSRWLTAGALLAVGVCATVAVARAPLDDPRDRWADVRTARAGAAARGFDLYTGRDGEPLTGHIYGPVGFWTYGVSALGRTPSESVRIATFAAILWLLVPAALLLGATDGERPDRELAVRAWAAVALYLHFAVQPLTLWHPHVDAPSAGLAAIACWAALRLSRSPSSWALAWAIGVAAAAAVWTKQTVAPVLAAGPALLWLVGQRRAAIRAACTTLVAAVALGGAAGLLYGLDDVLYTMFGLPLSQPLSPLVLVREWGRFGDLMPLFALALVGSALRRGVRDFSIPWTAVLACAVGVAVLGPSILGRIKISGASNNFNTPIYFFSIAAAALTIASSGRTALRPEWNRWARQAVGLILLAYSAQAALHTSDSLRLRKIVRISDVAYRAARSRPGEMYFPERPLAILLAEGRMDSAFWGLTTRNDAKEKAGIDRLLRSLPTSVRLVAVEPSGNRTLREWLSIFPRTELEDLPGWSVFEIDRSMLSTQPGQPAAAE